MTTGVQNLDSIVNRLVTFVHGAAQTMEIGEVERSLLSMVMEAGKAALEEFVKTKGTGYEGAAVVDVEGRSLPYVGARVRTYRSIFGAVPIRRAYYQTPGVAGVCPLDASLNLPRRSYSHLVQEFSSRLAVKMSYEDAADTLNSLFPAHIPIRSLEGVVGDLRDDIVEFYDQQPEPAIEPEAVVTVATVDKKGVVIRKALGGEKEGCMANPDKPGRKKMATVVSSYVTQRHLRSAEDILKEVRDQEESALRPKPEAKTVWGSLTEGAEATVQRLGRLVKARAPKENELVCILDGERSLWALAYTYFPTAFFVLDIFHVLEHLGKAALCFHDEGSALARSFVTERLRLLLLGRAGAMIGGLKQMLTKHKLSGAKRLSLEQVIGYLERNRKHMRYEICLAKGYPIGSGVIEGACRHLINDRLELTGMSWKPTGAESMIRLRAVHINKDWKTFWSYRCAAQRRELYGSTTSPKDDMREHELPRAA